MEGAVVSAPEPELPTTTLATLEKSEQAPDESQAAILYSYVPAGRLALGSLDCIVPVPLFTP